MFFVLNFLSYKRSCGATTAFLCSIVEVWLSSCWLSTLDCLGSFCCHGDCLRAKSYWTFSVKMELRWNGISVFIYLFVLGKSLWCAELARFTTVDVVWGSNESIAGRVRCCGENAPDHWRRVGWTCKHYCKSNACQTLINTLTKLESRSNAVEASPLVKMPGEKASSFHPAYGRGRRWGESC